MSRDSVIEWRRLGIRRLLVAASSYAILRRRGPVPEAVVKLVDTALNDYMASRGGWEANGVAAPDGVDGASGASGANSVSGANSANGASRITRLPDKEARNSP